MSYFLRVMNRKKGCSNNDNGIIKFFRKMQISRWISQGADMKDIIRLFEFLLRMLDLAAEHEV